MSAPIRTRPSVDRALTRGLLVGLVGVAACGGASAAREAGHTEPRGDDTASAPRVHRAGETAEPDGAQATDGGAATPASPPHPNLEHPEALKHFFEALAKLEDGSATSDVRITHFGDSHTAADMLTGAARRDLQARFGDGGRGFVAFGKPWRFYTQDAVRVGASGGFAAAREHVHHGKLLGDGHYGLDGVAVAASRAGARAWTEVRTPISRFEVDYLKQPGGGPFDLFVDGAKVAHLTTSGAEQASAFKPFDVTAGTHTIEARVVGRGEVRLLGLALDKATNGVVLDALGINGARVINALEWDEGHFKEQLAHRDPDLVVLAYGTNESGDDTPAPVYERHVVDLLGRVARAVPSASCLLLGPPDRAIHTSHGWETSPKIVEIVASQRRVAAAGGCAFYDQMQAMGGAGSMATWSTEDPPRAQRDRVHLTRAGYEEVGSRYAADVIHAYEAWRADAGGGAATAATSARAVPSSPATPSSSDAADASDAGPVALHDL